MGRLLLLLAPLALACAVAYAWLLVAGLMRRPTSRPEHDCPNCPLCQNGQVDECSEYQAAYGDSEETLP